MKAYLTVGEMGRMFGLNVQTLHYYDKIGLFCPQLRNPETGRRRYKFDQVYQLATIRYLRKLGYPLEDVRVYLNSRSPVHTHGSAAGALGSAACPVAGTDAH